MARLERMRALVGQMERFQRFGGPTDERERVQEDLAMLLRSLGTPDELPNTWAVAHWDTGLIGAEQVLDSAQLEADHAITECLGAG